MTLLSNTQRSRALHRVYTLIKYLDPEAKIERDDLHSIYQVNKYGLQVRFTQHRLAKIKAELIERYCSEYNMNMDSNGYYIAENGLVLSIREQDMSYFNQNWTRVDIALY
jgi:hypothetical protein